MVHIAVVWCFHYPLQYIIWSIGTLTAIDGATADTCCIEARYGWLLKRVVILIESLLDEFLELDFLSSFG